MFLKLLKRKKMDELSYLVNTHSSVLVTLPRFFSLNALKEKKKSVSGQSDLAIDEFIRSLIIDRRVKIVNGKVFNPIGNGPLYPSDVSWCMMMSNGVGFSDNFANYFDIGIRFCFNDKGLHMQHTQGSWLRHEGTVHYIRVDKCPFIGDARDVLDICLLSPFSRENECFLGDIKGNISWIVCFTSYDQYNQDMNKYRKNEK